MVGLQTLDLAIGVRVPASQPNRLFNPRPNAGPQTSSRIQQWWDFEHKSEEDHRNAQQAKCKA